MNKRLSELLKVLQASGKAKLIALCSVAVVTGGGAVVYYNTQAKDTSNTYEVAEEYKDATSTNEEDNKSSDITSTNEDDNKSSDITSTNKDDNKSSDTTSTNKEDNNKSSNITSNSKDDNKSNNTTSNSKDDNKSNDTTSNSKDDNKSNDTTSNSKDDNKSNNTTSNSKDDNKSNDNIDNKIKPEPKPEIPNGYNASMTNLVNSNILNTYNGTKEGYFDSLLTKLGKGQMSKGQVQSILNDYQWEENGENHLGKVVKTIVQVYEVKGNNEEAIAGQIVGGNQRYWKGVVYSHNGVNRVAVLGIVISDIIFE